MRGTFLPLLTVLLFAFRLTAAEVVVPLGGDVVIALLPVPPGTFTQGSPVGEISRRPDEWVRQVRLTGPFLMGKYPVTVAQFSRFTAESGYRTEAEVGNSGGYGGTGATLIQRPEYTWRNPGFPQGPDHPVVLVTWNDAVAFTAWLSKKTGARFALPTEAQWEYVAKAGRVGPIAAEAIPTERGTHAVGRGAPNPFGIHDIMGIWQWCEDYYAPYPLKAVEDPVQRDGSLSDKPRRVLRGGSWLRQAADFRPAARYRNDPRSRNADNGFRVVSLDMNPMGQRPAPNRPTASIRKPAERLATEADAFADDDVVDRGIISINPGPSTHDASPSRPLRDAQEELGFRSERRTNPMAWICGGVALLVVILFVRTLFAKARPIGTSEEPPPLTSRRPGGGGSPRSGGRVIHPPGQTFALRVVHDGFWIEDAPFPRGTILRCRWATAYGNQTERDIRYEGGSNGQFVFTEVEPTNLTVSEGGFSQGDEGHLGTTGFAADDSLVPPTLPSERASESRWEPPAY